MRNITLTIITILITGCVCNAKGRDSLDSRVQMHYGIRLGANYATATFRDGPSIKKSPIFGILSGFYVAVPINRRWSVQPELLFSQKGFRAQGTSAGINYNLKRLTSHLEVPVYLAYKPSPVITLLLGPQYSILIQQADDFTDPQHQLITEDRLEINNANEINFSLTGGLDFNLKQFCISTRYGIDLQDNNNNEHGVPAEYTNIWFQASIAYTFQL